MTDYQNPFYERPEIVDLQPRVGRAYPEQSTLLLPTLKRLAKQRHLGSAFGRRPGVAYQGRVTRGGTWAKARRAYVKSPGVNGRRVLVKARLVKLSGKGNGAGANSRTINGKIRIKAHFAYLAREGVAKDGDKGLFYDAKQQGITPDLFIDATAGDDRQFRFIVSPEDAHALDLTQFTRDLVKQMQADLGTHLEWIAVNHYNTDNPHTHLTVRGIDESGRALFIHPDYIKQSIRHRAVELVTRELGPLSPYEHQQRLSKEVEGPRYTSLDRTLEANLTVGREINLSAGKGLTPDGYRQGALLRRLGWLEQHGLARKAAPGYWRLDGNLKTALTQMQQYQRRLSILHSCDPRNHQNHLIYDSQAGKRISGVVVQRGLSDELYDKEFMVVDATDGNLYYVDLARANDYERVTTGNIVSVDKTVPRFEKKADQTIEQQSQRHQGIYDPRQHKQWVIDQQLLSKGAVDNYITAHLRRLNTLARKGYAQAIDGTRFRVQADFLQQIRRADQMTVQAYQAGKVDLHLQSYVGLKKQVQAQAATWLDKRLLDKATVVKPAFQAGFASEFRQALARRQQFLVANQLARMVNGQFRPNPRLLDTLRAREQEALQQALAKRGQRVVSLTRSGDTLTGVLTHKKTTAGGRYAIIASPGGKVTAIPWRHAYSQQMGRSVSVSVIDRAQGLSPRLQLTPVAKVLARGLGLP